MLHQGQSLVELTVNPARVDQQEHEARIRLLLALDHFLVYGDGLVVLAHVLVVCGEVFLKNQPVAFLFLGAGFGLIQELREDLQRLGRLPALFIGDRQVILRFEVLRIFFENRSEGLDSLRKPAGAGERSAEEQPRFAILRHDFYHSLKKRDSLGEFAGIHQRGSELLLDSLVFARQLQDLPINRDRFLELPHPGIQIGQRHQASGRIGLALDRLVQILDGLVVFLCALVILGDGQISVVHAGHQRLELLQRVDGLFRLPQLEVEPPQREIGTRILGRDIAHGLQLCQGFSHGLLVGRAVTRLRLQIDVGQEHMWLGIFGIDAGGFLSDLEGFAHVPRVSKHTGQLDSDRSAGIVVLQGGAHLGESPGIVPFALIPLSQSEVVVTQREVCGFFGLEFPVQVDRLPRRGLFLLTRQRGRVNAGEEKKQCCHEAGAN